MIQRIQSLYLIVVLIGSALLFFVPIVACFKADFTYTLNALGVHLESGQAQTIDVMTWPLLVANAIVIILTILAFFMYKNRILQNKIVAFIFLFNAAFIGLAYWITEAFADALNTTVHYKFGAAIPIISVLCLVFAAKAIRRDEAKVRAADRLR